VEVKGDSALLVMGNDRDDFYKWVVWIHETKKLVTITDDEHVYCGYYVETVLKMDGEVQAFCRKYKAG